MLLVAHGFLEVMVNMLVEAKLRNGKKVVSERQNYSHAIKLLLLNEVGVINDELYEHLDFLRDLRNSAAHSAFFQLASSDHDRVKRFLDETGPVSPDSSNLVQFNIFFSRTVGWLWNAHTEVFGPTLA